MKGDRATENELGSGNTALESVVENGLGHDIQGTLSAGSLPASEQIDRIRRSHPPTQHADAAVPERSERREARVVELFQRIQRLSPRRGLPEPYVEGPLTSKLAEA
jgi:hypothetical protein